MDYRKDLSVLKMLFNRLPFLASTADNEEVLGEFILEVMAELELCFLVDAERPETDPDSWVGWEDKYTLPQRAVVADIVCVYLIMNRLMTMAGGLATADADGSVEGKFLKGTKAGSVEASWEQFDSKKSGTLGLGGLLKKFQESARRKALSMGCILSWDNDDLLIDKERSVDLPPFIVVSDDCGCKRNRPNCNDIIQRG